MRWTGAKRSGSASRSRGMSLLFGAAVGRAFSRRAKPTSLQPTADRRLAGRRGRRWNRAAPVIDRERRPRIAGARERGRARTRRAEAAPQPRRPRRSPRPRRPAQAGAGQPKPQPKKPTPQPPDKPKPPPKPQADARAGRPRRRGRATPPATKPREPRGRGSAGLPEGPHADKPTSQHASRAARGEDRAAGDRQHRRGDQAPGAAVLRSRRAGRRIGDEHRHRAQPAIQPRTVRSPATPSGSADRRRWRESALSRQVARAQPIARVKRCSPLKGCRPNFTTWRLGKYQFHLQAERLRLRIMHETDALRALLDTGRSRSALPRRHWRRRQPCRRRIRRRSRQPRRGRTRPRFEVDVTGGISAPTPIAIPAMPTAAVANTAGGLDRRARPQARRDRHQRSAQFRAVHARCRRSRCARSAMPEVTAPAFDYWSGTGAQALVAGLSSAPMATAR